MNIAMITVFVKVGLFFALLFGMMISENWNTVKWNIKTIKDEIQFVARLVKDEIKSLGFSRWFSFRGKH